MPSRRLNLGSEAHVKTCGSLVLGSLWPMYIYHYLSWFIHNCGCNGSPWCSHIISNVTEFILWVVIWGWLTQKGECSPWGSSYSTKAVFWDLLALWLLDSIFNFLVTATSVQRSKSQSHLVPSVVNSQNHCEDSILIVLAGSKCNFSLCSCPGAVKHGQTLSQRILPTFC